MILLPGAILPAELAYGALIDALGDEVEAVAKDLEVYAGDEPPVDYSLDTRSPASCGRPTRAAGSGSISSATRAAAQPRSRWPRGVRTGCSASLCSSPPGPADWDLSEAERALWREFEKLEALPPDEFMAAFVRLAASPRRRPACAGARPAPALDGEAPCRHPRIHAHIPDLRPRPGVAAPVSTAPSTTPSAVSAIPTMYGEIAERLSRVFDDFTLEVFEERHHFDPPHRIEPERLAAFAARALGACRSRPAIARRDGLGRRPDLDEAVRA